MKLPDPRSSVAAQAVFAGPQDVRVSAMTPEVTGRGYGVLSIRVGRVLIYLEDRRALDDWLTAVHEAEALSDAVFGPVMPEPAYRPRGSQDTRAGAPRLRGAVSCTTCSRSGKSLQGSPPLRK